MYAVLKTGGKQYRVEPGQVLRVEKLEVEEGTSVRFDQVLMIGGGAETAIGSPLLEGAFVEADVLAHVKADKVISFVRRRRKHSSKRTRGHRQRLTTLRVTGIQPSGGGEMVRAAIADEAEASPDAQMQDESRDAIAAAGAPAASPAADEPAPAASEAAAEGVSPEFEAPAPTGPAAVEPSPESPASEVAEARDTEDDAAPEVGEKPELLDAPRGEAPDDLTRIKGVGPKLAGVLNEIGVFHFDQIAGWTDAEVAYMDARLSFKGRIEREGWIEQARRLSEEGESAEGEGVDPATLATPAGAIAAGTAAVAGVAAAMLGAGAAVAEGVAEATSTDDEEETGDTEMGDDAADEAPRADEKE